MTFYDFSSFSIGGGLIKHNVLIIHKKKTIFRFVELSQSSSSILFSFYSNNLNHGQGSWSFLNITDRNYQLQHSRNLFYNLHMLIHHMQVIWHEHPYRLNFIIKTLLQIKTRTTPQIQMASNHVQHHEHKITVFRPHLQPLIWPHWILHCILHLLSYTQQLN